MIQFEIPEELKKSDLTLYVKKSEGVLEFLRKNGYELPIRDTDLIAYYCIRYTNGLTRVPMVANHNPQTHRIHESDVIVVTDQVLRLMKYNNTEKQYKALRKQNEIPM